MPSNIHPLKKSAIAFLISRLLGPFPLLGLLWLTTAFKSGIGFWKALWVYPLIGLTGIGLPMIVSTYILYKKRSTDLDWSDLSRRKKIFLVFLPFWLMTLFLTRLLTNPTVYHLAELSGLIIFAIFAITIFFNYKISNHVAAASGVFWGINFLTHFQFPWLFLLLGPIIWSRYVLKVHTIRQLIGGLILSNGLIILALLIFGWPNVPN